MVLYGNSKGVAMPSDIIEQILEKIDKITPFPKDVKFVITTKDDNIPNAQVLDELEDGILQVEQGILSTITINPFPKDVKFVITTKDENVPNAQVLDELEDGILQVEQGILSSTKITPFPVDIDFVVGQKTDKVPNGQFLSELAEGYAYIKDGKLSTKAIDEAAPADGEYIIKKPNPKLPNAQSLSTINAGIVFNSSAGVLSTKSRLELADLPALYAPPVPGIELVAGQIWSGTASGVAEASNRLTIAEAELLLMVNRLVAAMWMSGSIAKITYPMASFVDELPDGCILKHNRGKPAQAISGEDYVNFDDSSDGVLALIGGHGKKFVNKSRIEITSGDAQSGDHVDKIFTLKALQIQAKQQIACEDFIITRTQLQAGGSNTGVGELWLFDNTSRITNHAGWKAPRTLTGNFVWEMPSKDGNDGDVLSTDGNLVTKWISINESLLKDLTPGLIVIEKENNKNVLKNLTLTKGQLVIADDNGKPEGKDNITLDNFPNLEKGQVWMGNDNNKAEAKELKVASTEAEFVLNTKYDGLDKAQVLGDLETGILKNTTSTGKLTIAKGGDGDDDDYVTPAKFKEFTDKLKTAKPILEEANDLFNEGQNLSSLSTGIAKIVNGKFEIAKGGGSESDDYITPTAFDEYKTQIEEKITEKIEEKIEPIRTQVEEIQGTMSEMQGQITALETSVGGIEGEIAALQEEIVDLPAAAAAAGGAAGATAGATAGAAAAAGKVSTDDFDRSNNAIYGRLNNADSKIETAQNDITGLQSSIVTLTSSIAAIDVQGTTNEIDVTAVQKQFTVSLSEVIKQKISTLDINLQTISDKINNLDIQGTDNEIIVTKQAPNTYVLSLDMVNIYKNVPDPVDDQDVVTLLYMKNYVNQLMAQSRTG